MTPSQKAHQTRYYKAACMLVDRLEAFPDGPDNHNEVLRIFESVRAELRASKTVLADAFWIMDNEPGRFGHYPGGRWHARLRRVRNTPEFGRRLLAMWAN